MINIIDQDSYNNLSKILESNIKLITGFINYLNKNHLPFTINHKPNNANSQRIVVNCGSKIEIDDTQFQRRAQYFAQGSF